MGKKQENLKAKAELRDLFLKNHRVKYPSMPEYARTAPSYSDKTANGLTKCIIDFIRLSGGQAERTSTTGRFIDKRVRFTDVTGRNREIGNAKWIHTSGTRGSADISAVIGGRAVKIEVKIKDRQSEHQKLYQDAIQKAGGIYLIIRSFSEFKAWYDENR